MIIDLSPLNYGIKDQINIDQELSFSKEEIEKANLIDIKNTTIKGYIYKDSMENYNINIDVKGKMIIPCSRTLEPTNYEFETKIEEILEENTEKLKKSIDILPIIWENILMEIPISIINEKAKNIKLQGDGWELITDSEN